MANYEIHFTNLDSWEYKTMWITDKLPDRITSCIAYTNRACIAKLLGFTTTKLTQILVKKYNGIHYGGRKWHSTFLFKEEDIPKVQEYIESLLTINIMKNN